MAVIGLCQQFPAGILNGNEGLGLGAGISGHPANSLVGGIVDALVGNRDNLSVIRAKVTEGSAVAAGITAHPAETAVGRIFDAIVGRVDSNQLVAVCN